MALSCAKRANEAVNCGREAGVTSGRQRKCVGLGEGICADHESTKNRPRSVMSPIGCWKQSSEPGSEGVSSACSVASNQKCV